MSENKKKSPKAAGTAKPVMTQAENDLIMNRLMIGFVAAVCAVTLVMMLKNSFNTIQIYETVAPVMTGVCFVLFALSVVFYVLRTRKKTDDSARVIHRYNVLGCGVISLFCGIFYALNPSVASAYSVALIIGACVLYFIRYIYPMPYLAIAVFCLCEGFLIHAGFGLAAVRSFSVVLQVLFRIGAVILPVLFLVGAVLWAKKRPAVFAEIRIWQMIVTAAAALLGVLLMWLGTVGILYVPCMYVIYALAAIVIAFGIVYAVKSI